MGVEQRRETGKGCGAWVCAVTLLLPGGCFEPLRNQMLNNHVPRLNRRSWKPVFSGIERSRAPSTAKNTAAWEPEGCHSTTNSAADWLPRPHAFWFDVTCLKTPEQLARGVDMPLLDYWLGSVAPAAIALPKVYALATTMRYF